MRRGLAAFSSVLLLISIINLQTHEARSLAQTCSSSCGDIQNISYPFRLKGQPASCGDLDYELSCENNTTIMEYHSGRYYVKQISYKMRTIRLVDVNLADGKCNLPYRSLSFDEVINDSRYQGIPIFSNNFRSFINCSGIMGDSTYIKLPCMGGNASSQVYVTVSYFSPSLYNIPVGCSFLSMIPVNRTTNAGYPSSYDAILNLLKLGFELGWSVDCRNCHLSNKTCAIEAYKLPFNYVCSSDNLVPVILKAVFAVLFLLLLVISFIARFIIAPVVVIVLLVHKFRKERKPIDNVENFLRNQQSLMPKRYSYVDLVAVTNHFRDQLGKGGFGSVYKGQLPGSLLIAVKMLENTKFTAEEFINEVSTIGRIHHVNVVRLLGYCSEGSHRALVYEYMPNGSLDKHIFLKNEGKAQSFSWEKLLEIALGTARGIEYLHSGCDVCILHFDIKPHNVLLDQGFIPKVADFGLAKFFPKDENFMAISTTRGTIGYIAPEVISRHFGAVSSKSDVYSFGMLLLEMAGGRKNVDARVESSSKVYFPSWVYGRLVEGGDLELEDVNEIQSEIARKLCIIGLWCIQVRASDRPSMSKVVEMLEGSIEDLTMPPKPFMCSPRRLSMKESQSGASTDWQTSKFNEECESMEEC